MDTVFDVYWQSSLKSDARWKQGKAIRRRVTGTGKTLSNRQSLLQFENNELELFHFIADKVTEMTTANIIIVTKGEDAVGNQASNLDEVALCSHE